MKKSLANCLKSLNVSPDFQFSSEVTKRLLREESRQYKKLQSAGKSPDNRTQAGRDVLQHYLTQLQAELAEVAKAYPGAEKQTVEVQKSLVPKRKPITRSAVARTFPGAEIQEKPNGWTVKVGQSFVDIEVVDEIPVDLDQMEKQLDRKLSAEERNQIRAAGSIRVATPGGNYDGLGIIRLAQGDANDGTLRHEALHLAKRAGLLEPAEWDALVKEYGDPSKNEDWNEEAVAHARGSWTGAKSVWDKIRAWLNRLLSNLGITPKRAADIMLLLDESGFWQRQAKIRKEQGLAFQPVGRPDLANPGTTQAVRGLVDEADEMRNIEGEPPTRPDSEVQAEAAARLEKDYEGEVKRLVSVANSGGQLSDTDTIIAKSIVNREGIDALMSGDKGKIVQAVALIDAYRRTGTEQGRAFRQRRDPVESPAERMRRNVAEAILTPPPHIREKLNRAKEDGNQSEIDRINKQWADKIEEIKKRLKALGVDLDNLNEWGYSPIREAEVIGVIDPLKSTIPDAINEYWRNAILSAPTTQTANVIGNAAHGAWHFAVERIVEAGLNTVAQRPEGAQVGELKHVLAGILPGISRGYQHALMTFRTELPSFDRVMAADPNSKLDSAHTAIPGKLGKVIRIPQRMLLAADQFARAMFSEMEVGAAAYRIATQEGKTGESLQIRIAELSGDIESKAWGEAYKHSLHLTFQQTGGKTAAGLKRSILSARGAVPGLRYVVPFVTFPINVAETAIKKSPLGSAELAWKMYHNYREGRPVMQGLTAQAAQQFLAGAMLMALMSNDEDDPWITGSAAQSSRDKSDLAKRIGRPPQSIKLGGKWHSYARIEPFATVLATAVDTTNALKSGNPKRIAFEPMQSLVGQLADKTFLSGLGDLYEALHAGDDWEERAGRYASNFAVSWVPNILRTAGRSADSEAQQRGVWGKDSDWWAMLMHRTLQKAEVMPVGSESQYDLWGRPIPTSASFVPRTDWLYRMTSPIANRTEDIFVGDRLILNWNLQHPDEAKYPAAPQKFYRRNGKTTHLTDEQYATYSQLAGKITQQRVAAAKWNLDKPTERDIDRLETIISDSRDIARNSLIAEWKKGGDGKESERRILQRLAVSLRK